MYDIYGSEGHKYALACVDHALKYTNNKLRIMYAIVCRCKKRLEEEFPAIKDNILYAVPVFHAYAHSVNCQVKFNPRYIPGFGNKELSQPFHMTATNRRLILIDAVNYYRNMKMINLQRVGEALREKFLVQDKKYWYYVDDAKYLSIPSDCNHPIIISVKTTLKAILDTKYANANEVLPPQLEDTRFDAIRDIANEKIARFLRSLLDSYCSFLLLNEYKLGREESETEK
ncbi:hypothetical protein MFLAVUS_002084 [Mucor flavus]|uniref:Uncharacterized protein n=1 Tax=Mucor flavus TaxID=439312 RepID=A0ABP9YPA9_9FUNG